MKRTSIYLPAEAVDLLEHLYVLRIIEKNKTSKGMIVCEALSLLANHETERTAEKNNTLQE